ncbi:MAG TPA: hypothetical protein VK822_05540 [Acetobacteraceae bacterium]|nr:hypothetical protein [Acetobacteraceae bacterium]
MDGISQLPRALRGNAGSHALALHTPHLRAQSAAAAGHVLALPQACQLRYHAGCPGHPSNAGRRDRVGTPLGDMRFHFLIDGTGLAIDLRLRPELSAINDKIAIWADRFTPPADEEGAAVGPSLSWRRLPFTERVAGTAPYLANIHNFTFGATPSMGLSRTSISGMKYGVRRLVAGLARDLYLCDTPRHLESLLACDTPELANTEPEDAPTPDAMPAPAACTS